MNTRLIRIGAALGAVLVAAPALAQDLTFWSWRQEDRAAYETFIDTFEAANPGITVAFETFEAANYNTILATALAGGTGPDVMMVRAYGGMENVASAGYLEPLSTETVPALADFTTPALAAETMRSDSQIYAVPFASQTQLVIYNKTIFDANGLAEPQTWDELMAAGQTLKDAGGPLFGDLGANVPAVFMALQYQAGAQPFTYDPATPEAIGIDLNDDASKKVLDYWGGLVEKGLVGTQDQFTPEYIAGVIGGDYATYISAAWAPGYLTGAGVGEGADAGVWKTAPLPQWDTDNPVSVNWGGSAFSVTSQAKNPELAAKAAFGLYADDASLTDGWQNQVIFPLNLKALNSPEFEDYEVPFFGGQQANKEVYVPAANAYTGMTYTPFGQYYFDAFTEQLAAINEGAVTGSEAADRLQEDVVGYAEEQGFTVE